MLTARSVCVLLLSLLTLVLLLPTGLVYDVDWEAIFEEEPGTALGMARNDHRRWEELFCRVGEKDGIVALVLDPVPRKPGWWTVVNPEGMVRVANTSARTGCRWEGPYPGVSHVHCPTFRTDQIDRILLESQRLVDAPPEKAFYGAYRPGAGRVVPKAGAAFAVIMSLGTVLLDTRLPRCGP